MYYLKNYSWPLTFKKFVYGCGIYDTYFNALSKNKHICFSNPKFVIAGSLNYISCNLWISILFFLKLILLLWYLTNNLS